MVENLSLSRSELEASIPSSTQNSTIASKDPTIKLLKTHLESLNSSIRRRAEIADDLRRKGKNDDIGPQLMQACVESESFDEDALFENKIKPYQSYSEEIDKLINEQSQLLEIITVFIDY